jgi:hypothetical protein
MFMEKWSKEAIEREGEVTAKRKWMREKKRKLFSFENQELAGSW